MDFNIKASSQEQTIRKTTICTLGNTVTPLDDQDDQELEQVDNELDQLV